MRKLDNMAEIIGWKHNHQQGMVTDGGVIQKFPNGIPSDEEIDTWKTEYDAHISATAYIGKRVDDYPTIGEQLDKIYHEGIDEWKKVIKAVKDKHPKPE